MTGRAFFNRNAELGRVHSLITRTANGDPEWLALIGLRKVGKSSLLQESARRSTLPFVTFDLFEEGPLGLRFFRTYLLRIVDALFAPQLRTSLEALLISPRDYRAAVAQLSSRLPQELLHLLLAWPESTLSDQVVNLAIDAPERLAEASDQRLVVAIDEFQEVERASIRNIDVVARLRSLWQRHQRVAYIVSGSERTLLREMISSYHAPFYGHFDILEMSGFPSEEALRFLTQEGLTRKQAEELIRVFGTHPYYLQLAGAALTRLPRRAAAADVKAALQSLLYARSGRLHLYFEGYFRRVVGNSGELAAALAALSGAPLRLSDLARQLAIPTGSTARYLERLGDVVHHRDDQRYEVTDPVFASWLQWRSPGGGAVPMTVLGDEAERLVAGELARMGFELVYQSRASRGAFDLLALRAHHRIAIQVKRRARLPLRFKKAAWSRMQADGERFGWRWMVAAVVDGTPLFLDPAAAKGGKEVRLGAEARIDNPLAWMLR